MRQAEQKGLQGKQALAYGTIMGSLESGTEWIGGELTKGVGKGAKGLLEATGKKEIKSQALKALGSYGLDIGENFFEEAIMEPLEEVVTQATGGKADYSNIKARMIRSGIDGALTSILMGGASAGIGSAVGVMQKAENGQEVTQEEIKKALTDINKSEELDIEKMLVDNFNFNPEDFVDVTEVNQARDNKMEKIAGELTTDERMKLINGSNLDDRQKESLSEIAEKYQLTADEIQNAINKTLNGEYTQNQETTTQNNEILNGEQQITQTEGQTTQNETSQEQRDLIQDLQKFNETRQEGQEIFDLDNEENVKEVQAIQKLAKNRNINITFDENRFDNTDTNAFYEYDDNGNVANIVLNPNSTSKKYVQNLVIHEMTHSFEGSKEYDKLSRAVLDYAKRTGEYDKAFEDLKATYEKVYGNSANLDSIVEKEAVANILGEKLGDQEFVNDLVNGTYSTENKSLVQKIYDFVKNQINRFKGYKDQEQYWNHVKELFDTAMNKSEISQEGLKASKEATAMTNITDSQGRNLSQGQVDYFKDSKVRDENGNLLEVYHGTKTEGINIFEYNPNNQTGTDYGKAFYFTSDYIKAQGYQYDIENDPAYKEYDKKDKEYKNRVFEEGISEEERSKRIKEWSKWHEDNNVFNILNNEEFTPERMPKGETKKVYLNLTNPYIADAKGEYYSKVYDKYFEEARKNGNDGIIVKNVIDIARGEHRPIDVYIAFNENQIKNVDNTNPTSNPDIRYSVDTENFDRELKEKFPNPATTDSNGVMLSKGQQDYFKNSKARDLKTGELVNVYHTTKQYSKQFNEFNPVGTPYYHFGKQVVNYYTDNQEMSGSYANQKYEKALTKKLTSMKEAQNLVEEYNKSNNSEYTYKLENNGDTIRLYKEGGELANEIKEFIDSLSPAELEELNNNIYHDTEMKGTPMEYAISWTKLNKELQTKYKDFTDVDFGTDRLIEKEAELISYLNGTDEKYFQNEVDLFKNLAKSLQDIDNSRISNSGIQYSGYVNIQNPYVIDANGKNWNKIEQLDKTVKNDIERIGRLSTSEKEDIIDFVRKQIEDKHSKEKLLDDFKKELSFKVTSESRAVFGLLDGEGKFNLDLLEADAKYGMVSKNRLFDALEAMGIEYNPNISAEGAVDLFRENPEKVLEYVEERKRPIKTQYGEEQMSLQDIAKWETYLRNQINSRPYDLELAKYLRDNYDINSDILAKNLYADIFSLSNESNEDISKYVFDYNNGLATLGRVARNTTNKVQTNDIVKQVIAYNNSLFEDDGNELAEQYGLNPEETNKNRTPEQILAVGGYDGVIIKNVVDYGGKTTNVAPHDLYVTFGSEQFKSEDNTNPTYDPDIRYSKDTTGAWNNFIEKYFKNEGTGTSIQDLKKLPTKQYTIQDFEEVINNSPNIPETDKTDIMKDLETIEFNKESLDWFKDYVEQLDTGYKEYAQEQEKQRFNQKNYKDEGRAELISKKRKEFNKNMKYDDSVIAELDEIIPRNRNGKRTVQQWKDMAKQIGQRIADLSPEKIEDIAVKSYYDLEPTKAITRYDNINKTNMGFEQLYANDWVNSVYEGVRENRQFSMETENQAEKIEEEKPKPKVLNPTQISNLTLEDVSTTPKLPNKKYKEGSKVSSFVSNIENDVGFLNEEEKQELLKDNNVKYYAGITNADTLAKAYDNLKENGKDATIKWYAKPTANATAEDVATGWILLKQYSDKGDTEGMVNVAKKLRDMGTKAGQTVQAFNILSRLTPEGMVAYTQGELQDAYNEMIKGKTKKWIDQHKSDFDLSQDEIAFIMDTMQNLPAEDPSNNNYDRKVALGQIQKLFTDKIPSENNKIKAWMRISMLFNPKTQVRNVAGNAGVIPVNMTSDFLGSKVDKVLSKYTGVRTLGNPNAKAYLKGMKEGFYQSYNDFKLGINTRDIEQNKFEFGQGKAFKDKGIGKALNRVDNMLNFIMDFGDRGFSQASFVNSLNNQMLLNGVTTPTQDMIDIATQEALSRTWNDDNNYTRFVLNIRKGLNALGGKNYGLGDVLIPFAKTPANLTKAIVEYSPVGLTKQILNIKDIKNAIETDQFTAQQQHDFADKMGKGLAGTLLYIAGYALAQAGIATGEPDEDKDVKNFMKNSLGIAPYSIKIGDKSFTYDWAQPVATPLAIMTNLYQTNKNNPDATMLDKIMSATNIGTNQLMEQSFMESLNEVLNGNGEITERIQKAILDLPARAIPTFSKQIADMVDGTQRTSFEYGQHVKSAINSAKAKLPFVSKELTPVVDTLGNEVEKYGGENNWFNVFFNPANMNKGKKTKAGEEIYNVYQETGDTTIFPVTAPYYVNQDGAKITMDSKQRAEYQKTAGDYTEETVNKLINDSDYQKLDDSEKAEILSQVVKDSNEKAKRDVLNINNKSSDLGLIDEVGADYYTYKIATKGMSKQGEKCEALEKKDYSNQNKQLIYESEINKEDKTFEGLKKINKNFNMNEYLKYKTQNFSGDNKKEDTINYVNGLDLDGIERLYIIGRTYKLNKTEKQQLETLLRNKMPSQDMLDILQTIK